MRTLINPFGIIALGLTSIFIFVQGWSLPEFCWSIWLAGLVYAWGCILTALLHIVLTARSQKAFYEQKLPFLQRLSPMPFLMCVTVAAICAGFLGFRIYTFLFGFYGLFLSVFAEMEPFSLFGRNGFINSDFFTPVAYLLNRFWPMAAGVVIANWDDFFRHNPWKRIVLPFQMEIVRLHIMILALPFLSLIAWFIFGEAYQIMTILLLLGLFYLLPKKALINQSVKDNEVNHLSQ